MTVSLPLSAERLPRKDHLGDESKRAYDGRLKLIEVKFGAMPIGALEDKRVRADFKEFHDSFSDTPRKADYVWMTIARVLSRSLALATADVLVTVVMLAWLKAELEAAPHLGRIALASARPNRTVSEGASP